MHSGVGTGAKDEIDCKDGRDSKEREEEWLHGRPRKGARKILERRGRAGKFRNRATRAPHLGHSTQWKMQKPRFAPSLLSTVILYGDLMGRQRLEIV